MTKRRHLTFLFGDEDFLIDEELHAIRTELHASTPHLTIETLSEDEATPARILQSCQELSLWGGLKWLIVKDPAFLEGEAQEGDADWFGKIPSSQPVTFVVSGSPDRRKKAVKELLAICDCREFRTFSSWDVEPAKEWVIKRTAALGKKMARDAAELLVATSGTVLRPLAQEIEKLVLLVGDRAEILAEDVERVASPGGLNGFALSNALRDRRLPEALAVLTRMLRDREEPVRIVGMLASQFRMLAFVKSLQENRMDGGRMASILKANPAYVRRSAESARLFSLSDLKRILYRLQETDLLLKTSGVSHSLLLEELVLEICGDSALTAVHA